MTIYIRKNIATLNLTFTASDGSATQPSAAKARFVYNDLSGASHVDTIDLTLNPTTNTWQGTWDTSNSGDGTVSWMAWGFGTLQAADQGTFEVSANAANTV